MFMLIADDPELILVNIFFYPHLSHVVVSFSGGSRGNHCGVIDEREVRGG